MKKVVFFLIAGIIISGKITAQDKEGVRICNYRPETKHFIRALDSLANFVNEIKSNVSKNEWNIFLSEVNNDKGLNSFNAFGQNSSLFQSTYNAINIDASIKLNDLVNIFDPTKEKSVDEIRIMVQQEISCYLSDTIENSIANIFSDYGRLAPLNLGAGPCEIEARTCNDNAQSVYVEMMMICGFGGVSVAAQLATGWWGVGSGGICALVAIIRRNNARNVCFENYLDCMGIPNPLGKIF